MPSASDLELYRSTARAREVAERRTADRRRAVTVLVLRFLANSGYLGACERLEAESGLSLSKVDAADNVDLSRVLAEWEEQQEARWGQRPRLTRTVGGGSAAATASSEHTAAVARGSRKGSGHPLGAARGTLRSRDDGVGPRDGGGSGLPTESSPRTLLLISGPPVSGQLAALQRREKGAAAAASAAAAAGARKGNRGSSVGGMQAGDPSSRGASSPAAGLNSTGAGEAAPPSIAIEGAACLCSSSSGGRPPGSGQSEGEGEENGAVVRRPLGDVVAAMGLSGEIRELAGALLRDVCSAAPGVRWGDIAGLCGAKRLLREALVLPARYPELFTGPLLTPWRGVLLFGPPGTGKTMLAKAVATECGTTFFNVSAATLVSKWRGDSEKLVRLLFDLARHCAPSTVFLDEVDALAGARGQEGEHEASRRMKTELLVQLDGLAGGGGSGVFVMAATNLPWELDEALLRRLERRVHVPLPDLHARRAMLGALLALRCTTSAGHASDTAATPAGPEDLDAVAAATEGFSGSDLASLAKDAAMMPLRRLVAQLEPPSDGARDSSGTGKAGSTSAVGGGGGNTATTATSVAAARLLGPVTAADLTAALVSTRPTAGREAAKHAAFAERYGQQGV